MDVRSGRRRLRSCGGCPSESSTEFGHSPGTVQPGSYGVEVMGTTAAFSSPDATPSNGVNVDVGYLSSNEDPAIELQRPEGVVRLRRKDNGYDVTLQPRDPNLYVPRRSCHTTFSVDLIRAVMDKTDFAWLCDSISRHDQSDLIATLLQKHLFSYVAADGFAGKRLLDFGCGTGASTVAMAELLPATELIGVELDPERIELANQIRAFRGLNNVNFVCSPTGEELPASIGTFDLVMLSAVYEHLLPKERKILMPLLWAAMKPGGLIFINQTPYRFSPLEDHSTGLWFVNFLPDAFAHRYVRAFAGRNQQINKSPDWNVHLRGGLRGGTEREIIRNLTMGQPHKARVVQPRFNGVYDRASFWLSCTNPNRLRQLKKLIASGFRLSDRWLGTIPALNLEVVIQKLG